jgi:predicted dehydrogenase
MKVGIAGVGFMGSTHAAGWAKTNAEIVGFTAETEQEAQLLADQFGVRAYPDFEALLSDAEVVDICTPTHLHNEMVMQAAAQRKDVICEKPLARTFDQAAEMVKACRDAGVMLLVAHVVRFFPEYALAKAAVNEGQIGRPGVLRLSRGSFRPKKPVGNWFLDEDKSGGILMDLMIHDFDYARWIAGEVESVFAKKVSTGHPDAPVDYGLAILKHKSRAISHIAGAWAYPPPTFRTHIELAGEKGLIEFDSDATAPIESLLMRTSQGDAPDVGLPSSPTSESPYTTQIKEFYSALQGGEPARVSPEDGLVAVQIAEAALASAKSGKAVQLNTIAEARS